MSSNVTFCYNEIILLCTRNGERERQKQAQKLLSSLYAVEVIGNKGGRKI
jgi:hypothetical protein